MLALVLDLAPGRSERSLFELQKALGTQHLVWVVDPDGKLARELELTTVDQLLVLDPNGAVIYRGSALVNQEQWVPLLTGRSSSDPVTARASIRLLFVEGRKDPHTMSAWTTRRTPRSRRQRTVLLGFVLTLALLGTVVVLLFRGRAPAALPGTASLSSAPLVTLTLDDGSTVQIGGSSKGPVVLYTVASWCPSCVPGAQVLATLAPGFSTVRFVLLSVDPTDSPAMMEEFLRRANVRPGTLRYALDASGTAARRLGARGLDQLIVFDSGGHVIFTGIRASQDEQLRRVLRSLSSDRGTSSGAAEHAALALQ